MTGRRWRVATVAALLVACGGSPSVPRLSPSAGGEVHDVGGGSVVVLVRPHATQIRVQLWIDAGAIDAASEAGAPEIASLAAWVAEARAEGVHARVTPDGTMLERVAGSVEDAIAPLARALASRAPTDAELMTARAVLRDRRRGRAPDTLAALEARAVGALFGPADPLGLEPEGPALEPDAERRAVEAFLAAHYGPERARWVVVGAVAPTGVPDAVRAVVADLPSASHEAPLRRVRGEVGTSSVEDAAGLAVAVLDPSEDRLGGALGLAGSSLERRSIHPSPCGLLAVGSARGTHSGAALGSLAFALASGPAPDAPPARTPSSDAEREGLAFVGRPQRCAERPASPLRSVVVAAPDHAERAAATIDAALGAHRTGPLQHLDVDGHTVALVVLLAGGASEDGERTHGRATVIARALARRCDVDATVEAERVVLVRRFADPSAHDIARTLRCIAIDPMPVAFFEAARAEALDALHDDALFLARAATAIAPASPGRVAPGGSPGGLAGADGLAETLASLRTSARMSVALVSPEPPAPALARGLGTLPAGTPPPDGTPAPGPTESFVAAVDVELAEVIVTLRLEHAADAAPARTSVVARLLAEELDASPLGVRRTAHGTGATVDWVAIAVTGPDAEIDAIEGHLSDAVARAEARLEAASEVSDGVVDLDPIAAARAALLGTPPSPSLLASRTLLRAPPRRVIVRPSTPAVRRR